MAETIWPEWVLDVSTERPCFVPVNGDEVCWELSVAAQRSPGILVGLVSRHGVEHAQAWADDNLDWATRFASVADLVGDYSLLEVANLPDGRKAPQTSLLDELP